MPASYPGSVKTFTTKVNGVDAPDAEHINDLQLEVAAVETELLGGWTDYSNTSTVTGWSSFTTKQIYYKSIGKLVFVEFNIDGTSNADSAQFTLPFTRSGISEIRLLSAVVMDNGAYQSAPGAIRLTANLVRVYLNGLLTVFTASGRKIVQGQFFFVKS